MIMNRIWAMPNSETFKVKPIGEFVKRYLEHSLISIDPFARNASFATYTNDLNPDTSAQYHLEAGDFLDLMIAQEVKADLVLLDPPYSPRQVKECYNAIGRAMTREDGWTAYSRKIWKSKVNQLLAPGGWVLNFGWNSVGMGKKLGYSLEELLLVCHGADHSDTICLAEKKI